MRCGVLRDQSALARGCASTDSGTSTARSLSLRSTHDFDPARHYRTCLKEHSISLRWLENLSRDDTDYSYIWTFHETAHLLTSFEQRTNLQDS